VFQIDEAEAKWAKHMFEWIGQEGLSISQVVKRLNQLNVPTKRGGVAWYPTTVAQIIHSPTYYGQHTYDRVRAVVSQNHPNNGLYRIGNVPKKSRAKREKSDWLSVDIPAIISKELWDVVQEAVVRNKKWSPRNMKTDYLLRGIMYCVNCGYVYYGVVSHERRVYQCGGKRVGNAINRGGRCPVRQRHADDLENKVWDHVTERLRNLEKYSSVLDLNNETDSQHQRDNELMATVREAEIEINNEEQRLVNLFMKGKVSEEMYDQAKAGLYSRREALSALRLEADERQRQFEEVKADAEAVAFVSQAVQVVTNPTFEEKRKVLESLRTKVSLHPDGGIDVDCIITDQVLAILSTFVTLVQPIEETLGRTPKEVRMTDWEVYLDENASEGYLIDWVDEKAVVGDPVPYPITDAEPKPVLVWNDSRKADMEMTKEPLSSAFSKVSAVLDKHQVLGIEKYDAQRFLVERGHLQDEEGHKVVG
jgi:site-specific DNA recombinase